MTPDSTACSTPSRTRPGAGSWSGWRTAPRPSRNWRNEKAGRARLCHAVPDPMDAARDWMEAQRAIWIARLDRMEAHILKKDLEDD